MARLNKHKLSSKQLASLYEQFDINFCELNVTQAETIFSALLGNEERIMLAKRLVAIILLIEGKSLYNIGEILKMSRSTVKSLKDKLDTGEYDKLIGIFGRSKKKYFNILKAIDDILTLGGILPHYNGPRYHWQKDKFKD